MALLIAAAASPTTAQERQTRDQDVLTPGTIPAPEYPGGAIILSFGQVSQVYFKYPFKSIRVADPFTVSAAPQTDHIIAFTGLAPGTSNITLESDDGKFTTYTVILVARPIHEVKIYTPKPADPKQGGDDKRSGVTIVNNNSVNNQTRDSDEADYRSILCNDIGCQPAPKAEK